MHRLHRKYPKIVPESNSRESIVWLAIMNFHDDELSMRNFLQLLMGQHKYGIWMRDELIVGPFVWIPFRKVITNAETIMVW